MIYKTLLPALGLLVGSLSLSHALLIDFKLPQWQPTGTNPFVAGTGDYVSNESYKEVYVPGIGNVRVTAMPTGKNLTWEVSPDDPFRNDGFGVKGGDEEVDTGENLMIQFESAVDVLGLGLTDLFNENKNGPVTGSNDYLEKGYATFNGVNTVDFQADANQFASPSSNGLKNVATNQVGVTSIVLGAYKCMNGTESCGDYNYSLSSLDVEVSAIPEPATIGLMGLGLVGLAFIGRRRKAK